MGSNKRWGTKESKKCTCSGGVKRVCINPHHEILLFSQTLANNTQLCLRQVSSPSFRELALGFLWLCKCSMWICMSFHDQSMCLLLGRSSSSSTSNSRLFKMIWDRIWRHGPVLALFSPKMISLCSACLAFAKHGVAQLLDLSFALSSFQFCTGKDISLAC
jgi:hypothetical protein